MHDAKRQTLPYTVERKPVKKSSSIKENLKLLFIGNLVYCPRIVIHHWRLQRLIKMCRNYFRIYFGITGLLWLVHSQRQRILKSASMDFPIHTFNREKRKVCFLLSRETLKSCEDLSDKH